MVKRIAAIVFIFICSSIAWGILSFTIFTRTYNFQDKLRGQVASIWGAEHYQSPPRASTQQTILKKVQAIENNQPVVKEIQDSVVQLLKIESSDIKVALELEHRQKGLLWYSTYKVAFNGTYVFINDSDTEDVTLTFTFPTSQAIYDDLVFKVNGEDSTFSNAGDSISTSTKVAKGSKVALQIGYKSQGMQRWTYNFGSEVSQVRNFRLVMTTNFRDIDFPENSISPSFKQQTDRGWELTWQYNNLLSGFTIAMVMPEKLQPGPLAGEISLFAPVSLFFFFFLMFIITTIRGIDLHPMNYFFLACAFFAFHLLLAYLVDHISIHSSFAICSAVSIFLVVSYMRLVVGIRFALLETSLAQFIYLVLFSYAFFFKGFSGLAITIGSIITLFLVMQLTGRIKWSERFAMATKPAPTQNQ
ncbi:MAG: inner membrane CreD family protein [Acidobacteriota bacterium]|nr:cell envelope integrity protein CreD [Blastocatellia bacterium]MDW8412947.1 inner membrane CreD family protein [Acidobacteriota bacterium]